MRVDDGRSVSNFLVQALRGEPITVFGDGSQTRSFCYVEDEVRGFLALLDGEHTGPINIGNPNEYTITQLAEMAVEVTELVVDDHVRAAAGRRPVAAPARPDAGPQAARLGARDPAPRGPDAHRRVLRPRSPPGRLTSAIRSVTTAGWSSSASRCAVQRSVLIAPMGCHGRLVLRRFGC